MELDYILEQCKANKYTAYEIARDTGLTAAGVQKILDGVTKKPNKKTLDKIYDWVIKKAQGSDLPIQKDILEDKVLPSLEKIMQALVIIGLDVDEIKDKINRDTRHKN